MKFAYQAMDPKGELVEGTVEADSLEAATLVLADRNITLINVESEKRFHLPSFSLDLGTLDISSMLRRKPVLGPKVVGRLFDDLHILISAGIPINNALRIVMNGAENKKVKYVVGKLHELVKEGNTLSQAMEEFPESFTTLSVKMVESGEEGGVLDEALRKNAQYLQNAAELRDYIVSALIYPCILFMAAMSSVFFLVIYVMPQFTDIFVESGVELPGTTQFFLWLGNFLTEQWQLCLLVLLGVLIGLKLAFRLDMVQRMKDALLLRLPLVGSIVVLMQVSRFSGTLGTMLNSGMPILNALRVGKNVLTNRTLSDRMGAAYVQLKEGGTLYSAISDNKFMTENYAQMIKVGEESGTLGNIFVKIGEISEYTLRNRLKKFISILEPCIILVVGGIIGLLVVSMLMGIFSINDIDIGG